MADFTADEVAAVVRAVAKAERERSDEQREKEGREIEEAGRRIRANLPALHRLLGIETDHA
jgi:hypothetical protein